MRGLFFCYTAASFRRYVKNHVYFEGNEIETDSEGYLKDTTQWSEAMAKSLPRRKG